LLLFSRGDQRREIARVAERVADLVDIQKEDLLAVADDPVTHQASAERSRGHADVRVIAAVEPVVVLLGQRTRRACRREHLLESREIVRTVRERHSRAGRNFIRPPAKRCAPNSRVNGPNRETLRDRANEWRGIIGPCDRTEVVAGRARLAVHAKECVHRSRVRGVARTQLVE
jgi:hypothetical protein